MQLTRELIEIIEIETARVRSDERYDIGPRRRMDIFRAIGPSTASLDDRQGYILGAFLPALTAADRVRAWVAVWSARHVAQLWDVACRETDDQDLVHIEGDTNNKDRSDYFTELGKGPIENVSAFRVPRKYVPEHILAMTELTLSGRIENPGKLLYEAIEWWGIYPTPERCPREHSIKWAAQEALYLSILSQNYLEYGEAEFSSDVGMDPNEYAGRQVDGPCGFAMLAYCGVFSSQQIVDVKRRREFWHWWLCWALPMAHRMA